MIWSDTLFIKHPGLFLPVLQEAKNEAENEVKGICSIFEANGVPRNGSVLDLSCGIGRHSVILAQKGYNVVGYDLSAEYIELANESANRLKDTLKGSLRFIQGRNENVAKVLSSLNMRFDSIIIMSQSIGYSGASQDDLHLFEDLVSISSDGCLILTEVDNRDWTIRNFQPCVIYDFEDSEIHETWNFDLGTSIAHGICKYYRKEAEFGRLELQLDLKIILRLYSLHEIKQMYETSGWTYLNSYGNTSLLTPLDGASRNMLVVGRKEYSPRRR